MTMKKRNQTKLFLFTIMFCITLTLLPVEEKNSEQNKIVETVTVKNIELPVRVFKGKQSVKGLNKEDFKLFVDGKERPINGFYSMHKKLALREVNGQTVSPVSGLSPRPTSDSRMFVLIFNITDHHQDLKSLLHYFFQRVIQPGDRLMVITNNYFFPEWKMESPAKTESGIIAILDKEIQRLRLDMVGIENELKAQAALLKSSMHDAMVAESGPHPIDMTGVVASAIKNFYLTYNIVLDDIKDRFLNLPMSKYIKLADYIRAQPGRKWVLNFFQLGRVPRLDSFGDLTERMDYFADRSSRQEGNQGSSGGVVGKMKNSDLANRKLTEFTLRNTIISDMASQSKAETQLMNDVSKAFINCGATFHTMILKPINTDISRDFKYEAVTTQAELVLKKMSRLTGGSVINSNKMEDFAKKFSAKEDIIYMLTYVPLKAKSGKVKVTVSNKKYSVVYDDQKRLKAFKGMKKKMDKMAPGLEIEKVLLNGNDLLVKLKNIRLVSYDGKRFGAVKARIKIEKKRAGIIADMEKSFKGIKAGGLFKTQLPHLARGKYSIILEVKDLFSLDNKYIGDAITITKK